MSPGPSPALDRLRAVLAAATGPDAEADVTPRELAELLWLATRLGPETIDGEPTAPASEREPVRVPDTGAPHPAGLAPAAEPPPSPSASPPPESHPPAARVPLHLPAPTPPRTAADHALLLAPAPPMLHRTLALQRALRPLQRKVPDTRARVLDERATADRIARLGAHPDVWLPVLRPAPDRWLRLNLVYDVGPTMPVWRPLMRELHAVLAQSGVFRKVTARQVTPDGRARGVPVLADGRTVTLIVTDCMGPQWRPGPAGDHWYRLLRRWAGRMPVAVVQPLPEHLWATTALPAEAGLLTPPAAAAPSAALTFRPYSPDTAPRPPSAVPLPVLEPGAVWFANWAALLADPGAGRVPGAVAWLPPAPVRPVEPSPDVAALRAEELVLRFRSTASEEAYRLAGHLSLAVRPSLPVMRLVQRALGRGPRPQHLAEIVLSGLLTATPGPPGSYDFRPGVRDLLQRSLPRTARGRTRELLDRVGALIDDRAGYAAGDFRVEVRGDGDDTSGTAFARVAGETVRRLGGNRSAGRLVGGRYRLVERRSPGRRVWQAVDERTGDPVVVQLCPGQSDRERFDRQARALAELDDPHVVRVLDHGWEGEEPYLAVAFEDGVTLRELENGSGPGVSFGVFARLAAQTTAGLQALHAAGLVRGQSDADGLLLRPDGTVVISRVVLGWDSAGRDPAQDFTELGRLVQRLARHVTAPDRYEGLVREMEHSPASGVSRSAVAELARVSWPRRMRFQLLGRPKVHRADGSGVRPTPEAQALLCMLLLRQGRRVSFDELAAGLWETRPDGPPDGPVRALAEELRTHLGPGSLAALPEGYALHTPDDYVDVSHCEELLARCTAEPGPLARRRTAQDALNLWYGEPLDRVPGPAARAARDRLLDLRLTLCATRAELDLELDDPGRAAADLAILVREHPDRADLRRLHTLAERKARGTAATVEPPGYPAERPRPTIVFEAASLLDGEARGVLGRTVTGLLSRSLDPRAYEVLARGNGYIVLTEPDADVLPVLADVVRELPDALAGLRHPPRLRVTFWHTAWFTEEDGPVEPPDVRDALDRAEGDLLVLVSPTLHEKFDAGPWAREADGFRPLLRDVPDAPPIAWYRTLAAPEPAPPPGGRDLVRGPVTVSDPALLPSGQPGPTAVVLAPSNGPLELLGPDGWRTMPSGRTRTYYEVDLTTHRAVHEVSLPAARGGAFAATVDLSWYVDDPLAFVAAETLQVVDRLLQHTLAEASRLTRRYPLGRASAAQRAVTAGLRTWPVPGLSVACSVRLAAPAPLPTARPDSTLTEWLRATDMVLLGFEGPFTRPFPPGSAREAALELLRIVAEHRHPDEALDGSPLRDEDEAPAPRQGDPIHPLDVLRAFADRDVGRLLAKHLDKLELRAVADARPTPHATAFVHALYSSGRRVRVITDYCPQAAYRYLDPRALPISGIYGREPDPGRLMPDPDCLLRALRSPGVPARTAVVIGSSAAEHDAARQLGLRFIGLADTPAALRALRDAGCEVTVPSLQPLLDAARAF
ncbi:SAV_2336 N-terminal domain-related protein [Streptomyces sp. H62]